MEKIEYLIGETEAGSRIDSCLSEKNQKLSRSYVQKLLKESKILANNKAIKAS